MANTISKAYSNGGFYASYCGEEAKKEKTEKQENTEKESKNQKLLDKLNEMNSEIDYMKMSMKKSRANSTAAANIANNFNPSMEMMKVASANNPAQVRRYIASVNTKIGLLKKSGNYDTLIKRFRKIITKAEEKITNLEYEEKIEKKAKDAERAAKMKEGRELREIKNVHKRHRTFKEAQDVQNAEAITYVADMGSVENAAAMADVSIASVEATASIDISM